jgi:hypothetical protein
MSSPANVPIGRLILVPAIVTLAVTLLRLAGELLHWSPGLFNREPGGGGALVGIVWLIPIFGIWFALRLDRAGQGPSRVGRALGWAALAFALNTALGFGAFALFASSPVTQLAIFFVTSCLAIAVAFKGWPELWRVLVAYGLAARGPVIIVMFLSIFGGWDTHYSKPRPDFPPMGPWGLFFWTALLPQLGIWIYLTVVFGMLVGAAAVGIRRLMGRPAASAPARGTV